MNKPWIAVSALVLLASPGAYASGVGAGDFEAGLSVTLSSTEIDIGGTTTESDFGYIAVSGGMFFTDQLEAKAGLSGTVASDFTFGTLTTGVDYLFTSGADVVPFAGGGFALGMFDTETDYLDVHGGVKYFFRERTSVEARLSYQMATDSAFDDIVDLFVGLNVYF